MGDVLVNKVRNLDFKCDPHLHSNNHTTKNIKVLAPKILCYKWLDFFGLKVFYICLDNTTVCRDGSDEIFSLQSILVSHVTKILVSKIFLNYPTIKIFYACCWFMWVKLVKNSKNGSFWPVCFVLPLAAYAVAMYRVTGLLRKFYVSWWYVLQKVTKLKKNSHMLPIWPSITIKQIWVFVEATHHA